MNARRIGLTLLLAALAAPAATADPPPRERAQMYEDIEIMRRLLGGKLHGFAGSAPTRWLVQANTCTACHGTGQGQPLATSFLTTGTARLWHNSVLQDPTSLLRSNLSAPHQPPPLYDLGVGYLPHAGFLNALSAMPDVEGTYLKGYGVLFTLTLPPPARDPRPEPPRPAPPPPSDWERIRREVRREKEPEPKADAKKGTTLAEVVLRALADNGKHFTQLGENESLTVVITFRADAAGRAVAAADFGPHGVLDLYVTNPFEPQPAQAARPVAGRPEDTSPHKIKDLILLGELHAKQGKIEEAIQSLRQALQLKPQGDQARQVLHKLAATLLLAGKDAEAEQVMKQFSALTAQPPDKPQAPAKADPPPMPPGKLILSAPKKLLDQVAAGKISFEEFQRAATVDYLTFPAPER
jgi:hypothetical protein